MLNRCLEKFSYQLDQRYDYIQSRCMLGYMKINFKNDIGLVRIFLVHVISG